MVMEQQGAVYTAIWIFGFKFLPSSERWKHVVSLAAKQSLCFPLVQVNNFKAFSIAYKKPKVTVIYCFNWVSYLNLFKELFQVRTGKTLMKRKKQKLSFRFIKSNNITTAHQPKQRNTWYNIFCSMRFGWGGGRSHRYIIMARSLSTPNTVITKHALNNLLSSFLTGTKNPRLYQIWRSLKELLKTFNASRCR